MCLGIKAQNSKEHWQKKHSYNSTIHLNVTTLGPHFFENIAQIILTGDFHVVPFCKWNHKYIWLQLAADNFNHDHLTRLPMYLDCPLWSSAMGHWNGKALFIDLMSATGIFPFPVSLTRATRTSGLFSTLVQLGHSMSKENNQINYFGLIILK